ncbi:hypothetical protein Tco_0837623 [Tanacetum coccineum]
MPTIEPARAVPLSQWNRLCCTGNRLQQPWSLRVRPFFVGHNPKSSSLGVRDHDMIYKIVKIDDSIRVRDVNMFKEASEEHSIWKCHDIALGHTFHPFGNVVSEIKLFSNAMSTQQDIYTAGSKNCPPMLNKENYVPWLSRLLHYAKNRKFLVNETFHEQTDDELTMKELKQVEADDQAI